ncbi:MAG: hypothetical protein Kapaf2KO_08150 [Candidatus Kapaibacteriales bacterium]
MKVFIQDIKSGKKEFNLEVDSQSLKKLYEEYRGVVKAEGELTVHSNRYTLIGIASGTATLECDLSLKEYEENVEAEFSIEAIKSESIDEEDTEDEKIYVSEDDKYIDISDSIAEVLSLALPMKRRAPGYEDKTMEDIYPELSEDNKSDDGRPNPWEGLKDIKLN